MIDCFYQGETPKDKAEKAPDPELAAYLGNRQHYQMIQREDQETTVWWTEKRKYEGDAVLFLVVIGPIRFPPADGQDDCDTDSDWGQLCAKIFSEFVFKTRMIRRQRLSYTEVEWFLFKWSAGATQTWSKPLYRFSVRKVSEVFRDFF